MANHIQRLISLFTSSRHSNEAAAEFHRWLINGRHSDEKDAALRQLWDATEAKADLSTLRSLENVYKKIGENRADEPEPRVKRPVRALWWRVAAAAVVAAAVSVTATLYMTKLSEKDIALVELYTSAGEMKTITLPDGSTAQTNSATLLLYPEEFRGKERTVYLMGEANFRVAENKEKPFVVKAANVAVTALGTEFNVSAYPEEDIVTSTLIHGKVRVDCAGKGSYTLLPGQQAAYWKTTGRSKVSAANIMDATAWQRGVSVFRGKTIAEILGALERRFNVSFQYNANRMSGDRYNFKFRSDSGLDEVLSVMKEVAHGFDYKMKDGVCYVKFR